MAFTRTIAITIFYHVLFWMLYVGSEYVADYPHLSGSEHWILIRSTLLALPLLMTPTYFVVLFAVPRYLREGKILQFMILVIVIMAAVFYGRIKWLELVNYINYDYAGAIPASKVLKNVIRDYSIIALAVCIYIISDWRRKEKENKRLMEAKAKADLELLKRQLHPHFLFNTLNNIYSLSLKRSDKTEESILKLSSLLEYLVYQSGEEKVKLSQEIELIKNYIELEKLRYGKELKTQFDLEGDLENVNTAPLILLPFVENCFKHGGKNDKGIFWVKLKIRVFEDLLTIFIENSKRETKKTGNKTGIGLKNIRSRMDLLYPDRYDLTIEDSKYFFSVWMELTL